MRDETEKRGRFIRQLEDALALSEELNDGMIGYLNGTPQLFGVVFRRVVGGRNCCALARWDADISKRCADKCKLLRFDLVVSRTFDFIQEPA